MFMKKNVGFSFLIPYIPHEDKKKGGELSEWLEKRCRG